MRGDRGRAGPLVTWPLQPADTTAAAAAVLGLAGLLAYTVLGPGTRV